MSISRVYQGVSHYIGYKIGCKTEFKTDTLKVRIKEKRE